jgi:peptide-methionine (R)-S-oxide reductase
MKKIVLLFVLTIFCSCNSSAQKKDPKTETYGDYRADAKDYKIYKTETEWKAQLTDMEYLVLRKAGTERAFYSPLNKNYEAGVYVCAGCDTPLFKSEHKFDSGTGWPSFDREIKGNVAYGTDNKLGYTRNEEHCATCGGHLGHVFEDGPRNTTGKRHCINGTALKFIPKKDE